MTALALPAIARAVPGRYRFEDGTEKARQLALILLELGVLDAKPPYPSAGKLCEEALSAWAAKQTGALHIYGGVALSVNLTGAEDWIGAQDDPAPETDPARCVLFVLTPWEPCGIYTLHGRCEAIEREHPGLAQTALDAVATAVWRTVFSWCPATAYDWRDRWPGWEESDESEGMLTLDEFKAAVPEWTFRPKRKLARPRLQALRHPVASATLALLDALGDKRALRPNVGTFWFGELGCVLRWSGEDHVAAMADDYLTDVQQSGEATDDFSVHMVELTRRAVSRWIDGAGRMLHTLGCLDRLLALLTEELHDEGPH